MKNSLQEIIFEKLMCGPVNYLKIIVKYKIIVNAVHYHRVLQWTIRLTGNCGQWLSLFLMTSLINESIYTSIW